MNWHKQAQQIISQVKQAKTCAVIVHRSPDGDALGSLAAMIEYLQAHSTKVDCYCSEVPANAKDFDFIFPTHTLETDMQQLLSKNYDVIIALDSGDTKQAGIVEYSQQLEGKVIINIDHHATNTHYGTYNIVDPSAASTTEILYDFFSFAQFKISADCATALLTGIVFDTYNFTNPNTSPATLQIASALVGKGARFSYVRNSMLSNRKIETIKAWGKILERLRKHPRLNIITTVLDVEDLENDHTESDIAEGVANFLNNVGGNAAVMILQQIDSQTIKGSLRTNSDLIDVSALAKLLGGGGHRKAAGFRLSGVLQRTEAGWKVS